MEYRINGFEQIKAFYSWVFNNQDKDIKPSHISLYLFLINQANRNNWVEWFKCPYDLGMHGSCIGSKSTYYSNLSDLQNFNLIKYREGINSFKAPLISIIKLYKNEPLTEQVPVPLSEPLTEQVPVQVTGQLPEHIYKLITNNLEHINNNYKKFEKFILTLKKDSDIKTWKTDFEIYLSELRKEYSEIIKDKEYISRLEEYHPKLNIILSIEKSCFSYWATNEGWQNKKKKKTETIDWRSTFSKTLTLNAVYK